MFMSRDLLAASSICWRSGSGMLFTGLMLMEFSSGDDDG
jgi:hypothetical protein